MVYRPMVPIRVIGPGGSYELLGLADSGADDVLLPEFLIERLGITIEPSDRIVISGITGEATLAQYGTVDLELARGARPYRWSALVGFYGRTKTVLGHVGFLDHFTATFNGRQRQLTLQSNGTAPPAVYPVPG
jgi:hypothetical protein